MSYSSGKNSYKGFDAPRGSHYRPEDDHFQDDDDQTRNLYDKSRDYHHPLEEDEGALERRYREDQARRVSTYGDMYSTRAMQQEYAQTEIYPSIHAPQREQWIAAKIRQNTRTDENEEKFAENEKRAAIISRENEGRMRELKREGIAVRDFGYHQDDPRHREPGDPHTRPSLDYEKIREWNTVGKGKAPARG